MTSSVADRRQALPAWLVIVVIWSTTPLAIQWSAQGAGFLYSLMMRMLIASVLFVIVIAWRRHAALFTRDGMIAAVVSGFGIFSTMMLIYWAAQFIPSGLIAVIFGLSPLAAAMWSQWLLPADRITRFGVIGVIFGLAGLWVIFGSGELLSAAAVPGILATLLGMAIQNGVVVVLKRVGHAQAALTMTAGGVIFAAVCYVIVWGLLGAPVPTDVPIRAMVSIIYLGTIGSVLGFLLYFWLLKRITAVSLSLVTLITPVTALFLGRWFNAERLPAEVWLGIGLIFVGLTLYQIGNWRALRRSLPAH